MGYKSWICSIISRHEATRCACVGAVGWLRAPASLSKRTDSATHLLTSARMNASYSRGADCDAAGPPSPASATAASNVERARVTISTFPDPSGQKCSARILAAQRKRLQGRLGAMSRRSTRQLPAKAPLDRASASPSLWTPRAIEKPRRTAAVALQRDGSIRLIARAFAVRGRKQA